MRASGRVGWRVRIEVEVEEPGADDERLDDLTVKLQRRLRELDGAQVTRAPGPEPPAGARGTADAIGELLVSLAASGALTALVREIRGWLGSGSPGRRVRIRLGDDELELDGASRAEQEALVRDFLDRHREP